MREVLEKLLEGKEKIVAKPEELRVLPKHNSIVLAGHAALNAYEAVGEDRYAGESKQVKEELARTAGKGYLLEVKLTPSMEKGREAGYRFFLTQRFASGGEMEGELARMREDGLIQEHTYSIAKNWHCHECGEH